MSTFKRIVFMAFVMALPALGARQAAAAAIPAGIGATVDQTRSMITEVRGGRHVGWGGRGFGHRGFGHRGFGHRGFAHRGWRHPGWRGHRGWGFGAVGLGLGWGASSWGAPVYHAYPSCVRRGWVWNGYRHVWTRYRVC